MKRVLLAAVGLFACEKSASAPVSSSPQAEKSAETVQSAAKETAKIADAQSLPGITLPPGFRIAVYAADVKGARSLALSPAGTLFVGTRLNGRDGKVYAIPNADGDAHGDRVVVVAEGLHAPNGVALHEGALYVGEQNRVIRFDDVEQTFAKKPAYKVVSTSFPDKDHHGWKFIAVGPDKKLYVPVGALCNLCESKDPRFASITRMNLDGSGFEIFANGVRNTVGFAWHPTTHELWFTDNGRDDLGDDVPGDELNRAPTAGLHFGYPYCHNGTIADPEFGKKKPCSETTPPVQVLGAHVAALGMRFNTSEKWPEAYRGRVFIAEHGSWNRSVKVGYRITSVALEGNVAKSYDVFAEGWLANEEVSGRPVDLLFAPDGSMLVSDDGEGKIYRISYEG